MNNDEQQLPVTRAELDSALAANRADFVTALTQSETRLTETMRDMQTELLRGFERYAKSLNARVVQQHATLITRDERLLALEERLTDIEKRLLQRPHLRNPSS